MVWNFIHGAPPLRRGSAEWNAAPYPGAGRGSPEHRAGKWFFTIYRGARRNIILIIKKMNIFIAGEAAYGS